MNHELEIANYDGYRSGGVTAGNFGACLKCTTRPVSIEHVAIKVKVGCEDIGC
jgi:hypothetical protein